ncbi:MAG: [FeFe] hydrogenase H-cluster maturation GTPase HydF [Clostridiales bacterium]|jgi:[FeFe] hydrogenase H-cluster maturation GTPase HydF|nr:[FeFe] hydrogenase H-cluster maturation GTPase HydF [Clostridiales bacterium]
MNETPSGERVHIGFFGRRNAGKSSVVNAVTGQELAVVSDVKGTTTDPVSKAMEILPLGPVVVIDTPGFDDEGSLGEKRVAQARKILGKTDIAVLVIDAVEGMKECDRELMELFKESDIPCLVAFNKSDIVEDAEWIDYGSDGNAIEIQNYIAKNSSGMIHISAVTGEGINELRNRIAALKPEGNEGRLIADKINKGDLIVLVVPIDKAAPKGRLILPQQQTIRDILDAGAASVVVRESELEDMLKSLGRKPDLVVTDSQVFGFVNKVIPADVPLTSFSILMARYKGLLDEAVKGVAAVNSLTDGDRVLIAEGCTHHRQCGDIGSVKIPAWLRESTGKELVFETASGTGFPEDLSGYALVVHCGGCMLNEKEVTRRTREAAKQGVPITNYGTLIAYLHGILGRSLEIFPEYREALEQ